MLLPQGVVVVCLAGDSGCFAPTSSSLLQAWVGSSALSSPLMAVEAEPTYRGGGQLVLGVDQ